MNGALLNRPVREWEKSTPAFSGPGKLRRECDGSSPKEPRACLRGERDQVVRRVEMPKALVHMAKKAHRSWFLIPNLIELAAWLTLRSLTTNAELAALLALAPSTTS